jgi:hypothetical protein
VGIDALFVVCLVVSVCAKLMVLLFEWHTNNASTTHLINLDLLYTFVSYCTLYNILTTLPCSVGRSILGDSVVDRQQSHT